MEHATQNNEHAAITQTKTFNKSFNCIAIDKRRTICFAASHEILMTFLHVVALHLILIALRFINGKRSTYVVFWV